ncbi:MAG: Fic family protein [Pseudomonadales bacterium]|nr:Fic family protein [Candidatus Woesebacteria bacterium]MCB9801813.1 Fic family protein [Pseudomonadales bacterium]
MYQPHFTITNNLLTYISKIEAAKTLIDNAPLVPAWEAKFRNEALTRTVHFGTKIEGNDLTEEQAEQVVRLREENDSGELAKKTGIVARQRDIQEVINYRNVLSWMSDQTSLKYSDVFTEKMLKDIHEITVTHLVPDEYVGQFRDKQVIVKSATSGQVVFRPPVSVEIPYLIDDFFEWALSSSAESVHAIFRAAITHYQLVYIHPFIEGNGRTARAVASLVLYTLGYDFKKFFSLEQYFDSDVEAYYRALLSVQHSSEADLTYWLEYFCYGLAIELDKVQRQVTKLSKDLKLKRQLGKQVALSERQIILLELFQNQEEITSDDALHVLPNVSIDTILRDIKDLIEKGVLEKQGVTKGVTYRLVE